MTSKSSFLVSMKENNKRRLWVWVIAVLMFVLALPLVTAFGLGGVAKSTEWIWEATDTATAQQLVHQQKAEVMIGMLGFSGPIVFFSVILALISGVQGFSYLYSRKKMDFYLGMPVKKRKRFLIIWLNGILLYVIPYLAGMSISLLIGAGNGALNGGVVYSAVAAFFVNICFYLGIYHLAILALMMTGNIVITGFGFMVFCLYEFMVRYMVMGYKQEFFDYFSYYGTSETPLLSPFSMYEKLVYTFDVKNVIDIKNLLFLLLFVLVVGLVSYGCYLKRPAEATGKAMTFEITKPFIKVLLTVPIALISGLVIFERVNMDFNNATEGIGWVIFITALAVVLGSALIQVIYEFDIKGALHKKRDIFISGALTAFIFFAFQYDIFGYDSYIPDPDKIESIAFVPENYEQGNSSIYFDSDGTHLTAAAYAEKYMYLKNTDAFCELAKRSMDAHNEDVKKGDDVDENKWYSYNTVIYRLKNGRTVYRALWVDVEDERSGQLLDEIIGSEEFKKGYMIGTSNNLNRMLAQDKYKLTVSYGNTVYMERMSLEEFKELLEIYQRDLELANFSNVKNSVPAGMIQLAVTEELPWSVYQGASGIARATRGWDMSINIYPFYEESLSYLKEHGYYMDMQLKTEDIASIQVVNNNYEAARKLAEKQQAVEDGEMDREIYTTASSTYAGYGNVETRVYADYTEEVQLKEIAECIYPQDLVLADWDKGKRLEGDYRVIVNFKADSAITKYYGTSADYGFVEGQVPEFVKEDTVYKE
ncbi:DUF6449 domain-containing protein [Parablautia muri]|uniref:DUF6449 domain-containing protein n=1 Tax=Parablautia muri TaxID=2320879 RepID=A0A9X5GRN1_9FIRM|nr:DUF6449 domain-containing protein [Parablautia muri]NBJ93398.1 hypothetical protein [Parablautia muri]